MGEQPRDLGLQRPRIHNLAQRGVGSQGQQVARYVKGARLERSLVGVRWHGFRAGNTPAQSIKDRRGGSLVGVKKLFDILGVELCRGGILAEIREKPAGFEKILVAGGALLPVPALLVHQDDGRQQAEPLNGHGNVGQIGDGAVAVLKIKGVQELLGALRADLRQRLAHGECGAGILGHGIGQHLRLGSVNGEDFGLVAGAGGHNRFTGHC